jgi:hypothetical protein
MLKYLPVVGTRGVNVWRGKYPRAHAKTITEEAISNRWQSSGQIEFGA